MAISTVLYIILLGIIALGIAIFFYFHKPERSKRLRLLLSALRFISIFAVLILLLNPSVKQTSYKTIKPKLAVVLDNSESMSFLGDSVAIREVFQAILQNEALSERFDLDAYTFGSELNQQERVDFSETQTDIAKSIQALDRIYKDQKYSSLLITDGNTNLGANYRYVATEAKEIARHFIVVGDTSAYEDLRIDQVNVNRYAYIDNQFPVEIIASYSGKKEVSAKLSVTHSGNIVHTETLNLSSQNSSFRSNFYLNADQIGTQRYTVRLDASLDETNLENNTKQFAIEVIDQRSEVLIIYGVLHPDLGTLKKSIESNQLRSVSLKAINDVKVAELNEADLVLLFEPNARFATVYEELNKLNKNRFTIIGLQSNLSFLNQSQEAFTLPLSRQSEAVQAIKNESFSAFQTSEISFANYPPLEAIFGDITVAGSSDVLFYQRITGVTTGNPLLGLTELSGRREVFLFGTGIFQWRSQSFLDTGSFETFDTFIDQLVQYAASNQKRQRLELDYDRFYYGGNAIVLNAQYFDKNYVFDPGAQLQVKVFSENEVFYESPLVYNGANYSAQLADLEPGTYSFEITVADENLKAEGSFTVIPYTIEHQIKNADWTTMETVAKETNGSIAQMNRYSELIDSLLKNQEFTPVQRAIEKNVPLIAFSWVLFLIITSLTAEWFIRKYNGLI